jgi:hypothetical protein
MKLFAQSLITSVPLRVMETGRERSHFGYGKAIHLLIINAASDIQERINFSTVVQYHIVLVFFLVVLRNHINIQFHNFIISITIFNFLSFYIYQMFNILALICKSL